MLRKVSQTVIRGLDPHLGHAYLSGADLSLRPGEEFVDGCVRIGSRSASAVRVAVLGGSTSDISLGGSWVRPFAQRCAAAGLDVSIYLGAVSGYSSSQELLKLVRDIVPLEPQLVVCLNGINDLGFIQSADAVHPMVHGYQMRVFRQLVREAGSGLPGLNNAHPVGGLAMGARNVLSAAQHWIRNVRMMRAVAEETGAAYRCFLQPAFGAGRYEMDAEERAALQTLTDEWKAARRIDYIAELEAFCHAARVLADLHRDFVVDLVDSFAGQSGLYADVRHPNDAGNALLAGLIFDQCRPLIERARDGRSVAELSRASADARLPDEPEVVIPGVAGGSRTVIFGAGTDCHRLLTDGCYGETVVAVLDNNPRRIGSVCHGFPVLSPRELDLLRYDRIRIASSATSAIHRQLRALGVPEEKLVAPLYEPENRRRLAALKDVHRGRTAVIVGNGPSLRLADLDALAASDVVTFAFNKIYLAYDRTPFRPTYFMVEDHLVAENNAAAIDAVRGSTRLYRDFLLRWLQPAEDTVLFGLSIEEPQDGRIGFSEEPLDLCWGASVTYSALQLALYMGCETVYLTGIDFTFTMPGETPQDVLVADGERNHFLPEYRKAGERWNRPRPEVTQLAFAAARDYATAHGCRIFNATRGGALEEFSRVNFDKLFPVQTNATLLLHGKSTTQPRQ